MANRWGNNGNSDRFYFGGGGGPKSLQMVTAAMRVIEKAGEHNFLINWINLPTTIYLVVRWI